jgi:hypothetical protein
VKGKFVDLTGQAFGRLTVLEYLGKQRYRCRCTCGRESFPSALSLRRGDSKSCGCYKLEINQVQAKIIGTKFGPITGKQTGPLSIKHAIQATVVHGMSRVSTGYHPFYFTWSNMMARCYNPKAAGYANYGGRGIKVFEAWHSCPNFLLKLEELGPRPEGFSIDRINNDGDYEPGNIRWASRKEQQGNRRCRPVTSS